MKLLYITNGINGSGGLERVLAIKTSYLVEYYGYEISILCLNNSAQNPFYTFSDKIKIYSITVVGSPIQYLFTYKKGIQRVVEEVNPDVISVCDDGLKGFFIPNIIGNKIPIVYERHASIHLNTNNSIKGKLVAFLMQKQSDKFDRFVVLTKSNIKEWKSSKVTSMPNPLTFYPDETALLLNKKIIAVGSHSYNKGYDLLLEVWVKVAANYPDWQLHIYGKIDDNKTYLNLAHKLAIDTCVYFHPVVANIQDKYMNSSILVLPSRSEGFGMVLIEAMACGVPCVSFDCPSGPRDIISNEEDGFLISPENIDAMVSKISLLIENQNLRTQMGERSKVNVKRYLPEIIMKQWDDLFNSLV